MKVVKILKISRWAIYMFFMALFFMSQAYALDSSSILLGASSKSGQGTATIKFNIDAGVTWPADGRLVITFPSSAPTGAFDLTGVSVGDASSPDSSVNGGFSVSVTSSTVTITRDNAGSPLTLGSYQIALANVKNPGDTGTTGTFTIALTNSALTNLDTGVMAGVVISEPVELASGRSGGGGSGVCLLKSSNDSMWIWVLFLLMGLLVFRGRLKTH
jgi:hypothetical protein